MSDGTRFRVQRFSGRDLDESWLGRTCRTAWDQVSGKAHGVSVVDAPDGGWLVVKAGRSRLFRADRSRRAARIARCLRRAGVATPEVHAVCTQSIRFIGSYSALVMEHVSAIELSDAMGSRSRGDWISAMARSIAAMHAAGVRHRDLKGSNVLLAQGTEDPLHPVAWIIDLDGARPVRFGVNNAVRARDLGRLELSLDVAGAAGPELLRAYAAFAGWGQREQSKARAVIDAYKLRKRAQNARRDRELT